MNRKFMFVFVALLALGALAAPGLAQDEVTISHYFSGELNQDNLNTIMGSFTEMSGIAVVDSPIGHEDFKTGILAGVAAGVLPDAFSYWAGARVQFVVDAGALQPIDDLWDAAGLDDVVPAGVAGAATMYNGSRYFIPFNIHYAALFYNPKVWAGAGIEVPDTWAGLWKPSPLSRRKASTRSRWVHWPAGRASSGSITCCCAPPGRTIAPRSWLVTLPMKIPKSSTR